MRSGFFKRLSILFSLAVTLGATTYAFGLRSAVSVAVGRSFYFLTVERDFTETAALQIQRDGGAGYFLGDGKVALSVYLDRADGEKVFGKNKEKYEDLSLCEISCDGVYSKSEREGRELKKAFTNLYEHISVLERLIERLDDGDTQENVKRVMAELQGNFAYLGKRGKNARFAKLYESAAQSLAEQGEGIVQSKKLRYLQCELCVGYKKLTKEYAR